MPKTKKHCTFSQSSDDQFVKTKSSYKDIQENVEFIECECESGEIGSSSEQGGAEEAIGEDYSDQESDWSTDAENGKGLGPVETWSEYRRKREPAQKEKLRL